MARHPIPVLHVVKALGPGGTEKTMQLLVTGLTRHEASSGPGFSPAVWSAQDGERGAILRRHGIPVFTGPDIADAVRAHRPAIIHIHRAGWPEPELLEPIRRLRRPAHPGCPLPMLPAVVETNVFGRLDDSPSGEAIDCTLFVSRFCAGRYAHLHGRPTNPPRFDVLYNPVDTDYLAEHTTPPRDRDFTRPVIGRISRPDPGKWSALALDFLPLLVRRHPGLEYRIIGGTGQARSFVEAHGLGKHVRFYPEFVEDAELAGFLDGLSVLAHANDTGESFGMVIAEAMACGLPVVTHPCPGWRDNAQLELVEHGVTGLVAATAGEYADALDLLLSEPDTALRMGLAAREKAQRLYRVQTIVRQLETLYASLLGIT